MSTNVEAGTRKVIDARIGFKSTSDHEPVRGASAWAPLRRPAFRALWIASLTSSIGTWMHEVGAVWLMTSLTPSPLMVTLMQTAASLPIVLMALPAGAIADLFDRRRMLLLTQAWMLASAALLALVTLLDATTPWLLLILTFALGIGAAMNAPAWQATTPEAVPGAELPAAVALTGMGLNIARVVGPAVWWRNSGSDRSLGGLSSECSFVSRSDGSPSPLASRTQQKQSPSKPVLSIIQEGIRYVSRAPALRAVLVRTGLFVPFASAL
jgi:MFS family permease